MNAIDKARDKKHLMWIHARLEKVHGENPQVDYMMALKEIAERQTTTEAPFEGEEGGNGLGHAFWKQMPSADAQPPLTAQETILADIAQMEYKREKEV
jgi:hypothetical protein